MPKTLAVCKVLNLWHLACKHAASVFYACSNRCKHPASVNSIYSQRLQAKAQYLRSLWN